jgi:hypothetical protein
VPRLKDRRSFVPAGAAAFSPIAARHLAHFSSLDFLPGDEDGDDCPPTWAVLDSRGSLLLLYRMASGQRYDGIYPDCVVCEPATRRYKRIPRPPNLKLAGRTTPSTKISQTCTTWATPGVQYFYVRGRNLVALDRSSGEFSHAVFPPPSEENDDDDFDLVMWTHSYATDGRDGEPRIFTVFDETMKVYAKLDGGEWALEKSLSLREATRGLPGYKEEFFGQRPLEIVTRGPGYVTLSPGILETTWEWLISVDLETMQVVELAAADTGGGDVPVRDRPMAAGVEVEQRVDRTYVWMLEARGLIILFLAKPC